MSFFVSNIYRPPDLKIEYNDRFEEFIDFVSNQNKDFIWRPVARAEHAPGDAS